MDHVILSSGEWAHGPIGAAESFVERWRGLKGRGAGTSFLIKTTSIHSFGMAAPFRATGLSDRLEVVDTRVVAPSRVIRFPGCRYVLETPLDVLPPAPGTTLEMRRV